jgi:pimeloyl-ACP methyl ester carboxylesterase
VGRNDEKFRHIGTEMKNAMGANAELVEIENAGHSVHLEQPLRCQSVASEFLN